MNVLVAGANGFIGGNVVRALEEGVSDGGVVGLDRHPLSKLGLKRYYSLDIGDRGLTDIAAILEESEIDAIVNCAGTTNVGEGRPKDGNLNTTVQLLEAAARYREGIVFCQVGSSAEYGMLLRPERTSEASPEKPLASYGRGKLEATRYVLEATRNGRVSGFVLRLFNPIGIGMPNTQLVGRVCEYLFGPTSQALDVGDLGGYRDYVDVRSVSLAIVSSLLSSGRIAGEVINIGSGTASSTRSLVTGLLAAVKRGRVVEVKGTGSVRSEGLNWQEADISKARRLLQWEPHYSLEETTFHLASSLSDVTDLPE